MLFFLLPLLCFFFFFFQAEDGIRDFHVTGVQTCALPILEKARWTFTVALTVLISFSLSDPPRHSVSSVLSSDRKSTRLNSSHVKISYAVFCLKKKKKTKTLHSSKNI